MILRTNEGLLYTVHWQHEKHEVPVLIRRDNDSVVEIKVTTTCQVHEGRCNQKATECFAVLAGATSIGRARCSVLDQFEYEKARRISLGRALYVTFGRAERETRKALLRSYARRPRPTLAQRQRTFIAKVAEGRCETRVGTEGCGECWPCRARKVMR